MTMKAMYNAGAQLSLAELNKNISKAGRALARISTGQRIIGAQDDDSTSFAISEKMREQIRSLLQDNNNVQNGSSMLKTAERGIDLIVQELKTLKELAIDAANDSNIDDDRRTMQKEFDSRIATINEIAIGTEYNGKILLDGRWNRGGIRPVKDGAGGKNTNVTNLVDAISPANNATTSDKTTSYTDFDPTTQAYTPYSSQWSFDVDKSFKSSNYTFAATLDFSAMQTQGTLPDALQGQGFTILCGTCRQYINFLFDSTLSATESGYNSKMNSDNPYAREFIIGVKDVTDPNDLAEAIFKGVERNKDKIDPTGYYTNTPNKDALIDYSHTLRIARDTSDPSKMLVWKNGGGSELQFKESTIPNPLTDPIKPVEVEVIPWNPLIIHHGTQSGQRVNVYINSMQTKDLGLDNVNVTTRDNAISAITSLDSALNRALDEATNLGAWLQRLEYTDSNVTTMGENVQNAESTIRDADMAKEMTEYTKYNVLTQSSQAMLAQANQNGSAILSLLQ